MAKSGDPITAAAFEARLFDDNPAVIDLLGFDAVVAPVVRALAQADLDPITVGVHAPWGGGKSTVLNLIDAARKDGWIVIRTNPWEYEDVLDVKGTLISTVLEEIRRQTKPNETLQEKFKGLFDRIDWRRTGVALAKGVVTVALTQGATLTPGTIIESFKTKDEERASTVGAFRAEFEELLSELKVTRVVVLVDDLDRCLPEAALATLEAIKLFLSVRKMAFVIAADQDMVRDAIAAALDNSARAERFAKFYLEKIVQLPVSLPRLSEQDAEAYIGLLLYYGESADRADLKKLAEHCAKRRRAGQVPYLEGHEQAGANAVFNRGTQKLATQLNEGLNASSRGNPREIKRFLNSYAIRETVARQRGVRLNPSVLLKLMLLEEQYSAEFKALVAAPMGERQATLARWEEWCASPDGKERPKDLREDVVPWVRSEPKLADEDLESYFALAATFVAATLGSALGENLRTIVRQLLSEAQITRDTGAEAIKDLSAEEAGSVADAIVEEGRRGRIGEIAWAMEAFVAIARAKPDLAPSLERRILDHLYDELDPASVTHLGRCGVPQFEAIVERMAKDDRLDSMVRETAKLAREGG